MTNVYLLVASVLLVLLGAGTYRALRGPTPGDRILVLQYFGTAAVAVLILLGEARNDPTLVDVALVLALLSAISVVAFVRCAWAVEDSDEPRH